MSKTATVEICLRVRPIQTDPFQKKMRTMLEQSEELFVSWPRISSVKKRTVNSVLSKLQRYSLQKEC